jgi:hypothetical protein
MFDTLAESFGDRMIRLAPPREVCLADPHHRWGLTSYHLVTGYHHWLLDRLLALEQPKLSPRRTVTTSRLGPPPWWGRRGVIPSTVSTGAPGQKPTRSSRLPASP